MHLIRYVNDVLREFWAHWISYMVLVGVIGAVISLVIIPALRWATRAVLVWGHIPYLTFTNAPNVAMRHPVVALTLLALGIIVLILVYVQFAFLLGGVDSIQRQQYAGWRQLVTAVWADLRHLRWTSFAFFAPYCLIIVPFAGFVVGSSLLAKVRIPIFIIAWLGERPALTVMVVVFYIIMAYLAVRWLRVLPLSILGEQHLRAAARQSWRKTRGHWWFYFWRATYLSLVVWVIAYAWSEAWIMLQRWFDGQSYAYGAAIVIMAIMVIGKVVLGGMGSIAYLLFLINPHQMPATVRGNSHNQHPRWQLRVSVGVAGIAALGLLLTFDAVYLKGAMDYHPLTISHRGVDGTNGVQNTIPALQRTAREHPDYVEMDIHETKDDQFVVLHDENLKDLAGINKTPKQMTLNQLKHVTVHEHGRRAPLATFDDYLAAANAAHQKLIVEIKTTPHDSPMLMHNFIHRYAKTLITHHDRVHSLNYHVVTDLRRRVPKLYTSFILPYALVFPKTDANAYTFEETTLDDTFVDAAHTDHQEVWAWTVNDADSMEQMMFAGVDGIITDHLHLLQETIHTHSDHPSYAERLQYFSNSLDDVSAQSEVD